MKSSLLTAPCIIAPCIIALTCLSVRGEELDFGDHSSSTLTGKAWDAFGKKKYADAVGYATKCVELYEKQAVEMQKELKAPVPEDEKDAVQKKWALNDVGTSLYILGQSLEKQDKPKEAIVAYKKLVDKVSFAQCWDPQGWFWKPGEAAKERIAELETEAKK